MGIGEKKISIIVPVFNEAGNILPFATALADVLARLPYAHEIIFVNDGSADTSAGILCALAARDDRIKIIEFSRNFGKEIALTAGLNACSGDAAIMIDADLQHPVELIPEFIARWEQGAEVVVGVRRKNCGAGMVKWVGSFLFYKIMNHIADTPLTPNATDYRLLDRSVIHAFNQLTERNRMTRGLIAWLGFRRDYLFFDAKCRVKGEPQYNIFKLTKLALLSFISLSLFPLKFAGYLGVFIMVTSGFVGLFIFIEKYVLDDPWGMRFSGSATLAIIVLFLIGIVLSCLGLIALYIAHIHDEVINRPIYVIRKSTNM